MSLADFYDPSCKGHQRCLYRRMKALLDKTDTFFSDKNNQIFFSNAKNIISKSNSKSKNMKFFEKEKQRLDKIKSLEKPTPVQMFLSGQIGGAVYFCKSAEIKKMNRFLNYEDRKLHREKYLQEKQDSNEDFINSSEDSGVKGKEKLDKREKMKIAKKSIKEELRQVGLSKEEISVLKLRLRKIKRAEQKIKYKKKQVQKKQIFEQKKDQGIKNGLAGSSNNSSGSLSNTRNSREHPLQLMYSDRKVSYQNTSKL